VCAQILKNFTAAVLSNHKRIEDRVYPVCRACRRRLLRGIRSMKYYFVYIVECSEGSYYTGITSNLEKRINEHNTGKYKSYTSRRLPVRLLYTNRFTDVKEAIRTEKQIKGWNRAKKEALIKGDFEKLVKLSKSKKS
jgi:putative endonuclease